MLLRRPRLVLKPRGDGGEGMLFFAAAFAGAYRQFGQGRPRGIGHGIERNCQ